MPSVSALLRRTAAVLGAAAAVLPAPAGAADNELTLWAGYRTGGGFVDASTEQNLSLNSAAAFAATLDLPLDAARQIRLLVSSQDTDLPLSGTAGTAALPMRVTYLHLGGTNFWEGRVGTGPYLSGGLGVTLFSPSPPGYSSEIGFSFGLGLGYVWPLSPTVALRAEARGYVTLINTSGALFCSGGCVVQLRGDAFTQADLQIGLTIRF